MARDVGDWNLRLFRGESRVYTMTIQQPIESSEDPEDGYVDLTDAVLYFTVRLMEGGDDAIIYKTSADPDQIEILDQDTNKGQFKLKIGSRDTNGLAAKQYRYDVWVTFPGDDVARIVVLPSMFEIRPACTVLPPS